MSNSVSGKVKLVSRWELIRSTNCAVSFPVLISADSDKVVKSYVASLCNPLILLPFIYKVSLISRTKREHRVYTI